MGQSGPKSSAPGGYGTLSAKGYRRVYDPEQQRNRMEHVLVWERANGPMPNGMQVHHRNGVKLDNTLENLEVVDTLTHKRIHSGCEILDGEWWKPCRKCDIMQHISEFYKRKTGISPWCRKCCIRYAVANKQHRKEREHS